MATAGSEDFWSTARAGACWSALLRCRAWSRRSTAVWRSCASWAICALSASVSAMASSDFCTAPICAEVASITSLNCASACGSEMTLRICVRATLTSTSPAQRIAPCTGLAMSLAMASARAGARPRRQPEKPSTISSKTTVETTASHSLWAIRKRVGMAGLPLVHVCAVCARLRGIFSRFTRAKAVKEAAARELCVFRRQHMQRLPSMPADAAQRALPGRWRPGAGHWHGAGGGAVPIALAAFGPGCRGVSEDPRHARRPEAQIRRLALAATRCAGVVQRAQLQRFFAQLAAPAQAIDPDAADIGGGACQAVLVFQIDQQQTPAAVGHGLEFAKLERGYAPAGGGAGHMRGRQHRRAAGAAEGVRGRAWCLAPGQREEGLAALLARNHVFDRRQKTVAARVGQQQRGLGRAGKVVQHLGAGFQLDQRGDGLAIAARAGQQRYGHRIHPAV